MKTTFLIDSEFMRKRIISCKSFYYDGPNIREYCCKHLQADDTLAQIRVYDSMPFHGEGHHPLTGHIDFSTTPPFARKKAFIDSLHNTPNVMIRLGFSTWQYDSWNISPSTLGQLIAGERSIDSLSSTEIFPDIRQKGVDVFLGIDAALIAFKRLADKVVMICNDADFVPAVELLRSEGIQVVLDPLGCKASEALRNSVDCIENILTRSEIREFWEDKKDIHYTRLSSEFPKAKVVA